MRVRAHDCSLLPPIRAALGAERGERTQVQTPRLDLPDHYHGPRVHRLGAAEGRSRAHEAAGAEGSGREAHRREAEAATAAASAAGRKAEAGGEAEAAGTETDG